MPITFSSSKYNRNIVKCGSLVLKMNFEKNIINKPEQKTLSDQKIYNQEVVNSTVPSYSYKSEEENKLELLKLASEVFTPEKGVPVYNNSFSSGGSSFDGCFSAGVSSSFQSGNVSMGHYFA